MGVVPGAAAVFVVWLPVAFAEAQRLEFVILLPLPLIAAFLLIWTPVAWLLFPFTRQWSGKQVLGAGTETAAMCWLVLPWLLATIAFPILLDENNEAVAAFAAIGVGLLWSKLVSDPFARFVTEIWWPSGANRSESDRTRAKTKEGRTE